jgi:hypothetical protein
MHERRSFSRAENPGRLWRVPTGLQIAAVISDRTANMTERQTYLAHVRNQMRQEGVFLEVDEYPSQPGARR